MRRALVLIYGVLGVASFIVAANYLIGFLADFVVPKAIDTGPASRFWMAIAIDIGLLALFAIQHSVMARLRFKRWWTRLIPRSIERSTYVVSSSLLFALLVWQWHPIEGVIWEVSSGWTRVLLWSLFAVGWGVATLAGFNLDFAYMFGLKQAYNYARRREPAPLRFQTPGLYRYLRHPVTLGFLLGFWITPRMTTGHLLFASAMSAYLLIALKFEERDLVEKYGDQYTHYQDAVPMLFPIPGRSWDLGAPHGKQA